MALQFFVFCCLCNSISHGLCCVVQISVSFWCRSIGQLCKTNMNFLLCAESWRWLVVAHSAAKFRYWQATHHCCPSYHEKIVACSVPLCKGAEPASTQTSTAVQRWRSDRMHHVLDQDNGAILYILRFGGQESVPKCQLLCCLTRLLFNFFVSCLFTDQQQMQGLNGCFELQTNDSSSSLLD